MDASCCRSLKTLCVQGNWPAVLVCKERCSDKDFDDYITETIVPLCEKRGFVIGMSDNVPSNADFARVERVSNLLRRYTE